MDIYIKIALRAEARRLTRLNLANKLELRIVRYKVLKAIKSTKVLND